jgi:AcrR family transcriptional regulator
MMAFAREIAPITREIGVSLMENSGDNHPERRSAYVGRVLAAAAEEFATAGLSRTKIDSIAIRAGVSRQFIYKLFANKVDLYRVMRSHLEDTYYRRLAQIDLDALAPNEAIDTFLSCFASLNDLPLLASCFGDQLLYGVGGLTRSNEAASLFRRIRSRLSRTLDRGRAQGLFNCDWDGAVFYLMSFSAMFGAVSATETSNGLAGRLQPSLLPSVNPAPTTMLSLVRRALHSRSQIPLRRSSSEAWPPVATRERRASSAVERILDAAEASFGAAGLDRTTIGTVARTSAVSSQLVYHYFHSKTGLYRGVLERMTEDSLELLMAFDYEASDPVVAIRTLLDRMWWCYSMRPALARMTIDQILHPGPHMRWGSRTITIRRALLQRIEHMLQRGRQDGRILPSLDASTLFLFAASLFAPVGALLQPSRGAPAQRVLYEPIDIGAGKPVEFLLRCIVI